MTARGVAWVTGLSLLAVLLQASWLNAMPIHGEWPDLALIVVVLCALLFSLEAGLLSGLVAGLAIGLIVDTAALAFVLSRLGVAYLVGHLRVHWHRENLIARVAAVVLGSLCCEAIFAILHPGVLQTPGWAGRVWLRALLNAALTPFVAPLIERAPIEVEVVPE